jgi:hypothetical protein
VAPDVRAEATAVGIARSRSSSVVYLVAKGTRGNSSRSPFLEAMPLGGRTSLPRESGDASHCLASPVSDGEDDDLAAFVDRLFAGHLDRVAGSLRARYAVGRSLVWGNVAAACASAAGSVQAATRAPWPDRLRAFLAAAPHDLAALGNWSFPSGASPTYRRTTCCLWWKTSAAAGALCADCSLARSPIETSPT